MRRLRKNTTRRHWLLVLGILLIPVLVFVGVALHTYITDTQQARQQRYDQMAKACGHAPFILLNQKFISVDSVAPDQAGYNEALKTYLTPHTSADLSCQKQ